MNTTKELILKHAFFLFLKRSYNNVSLEDIQNKAEISRGGLYHHFKKGKKQIFEEVIDEYLFPSISAFSKVELSLDTTLREAIRLNLSSRKKFIQYLRNITSNELSDFFYFKLAFQADEFYDDFSSKVKKLLIMEQERWKICIVKAMEKGEIRQGLNVDVIAQSFLIIPQGLGLNSAFDHQLKVENLENAYYNLYDLIKI